MQTQKIAALAVSAVLLLVGGTFLFTQIFAPARQLEACTRGSIAGGNIGGPFDLVDHTGQPVTQDDVITGPTLLYFGYTFCPDVCPVDVARNAVAIEILEEDMGHLVTPVFVTIDPARDTVAELADFVAYQHPRMVGLTGTRAAIDAAAKEYRVFYQKQDTEEAEFYLMDHSTFSYLMFPELGFVEFFRNDLSPEQMAERIACFVEAV